MSAPSQRVSPALAGLVVAGVAVAALVLGGLGGAVAGALTADDGATGSNSLPEPPAEFPNISQLYLPQVTVGQVETWLTAEYGFTCKPGTNPKPTSGAAQERACRAPEKHTFAQVYIQHDKDGKVRELWAPCTRGARTPEDYCRQIFSIAAGAAFVGQPQLQEQAAAWAAENAERDAFKVFGAIELITDLHSHSLRLLSAA